jgi:hypothetical protein
MIDCDEFAFAVFAVGTLLGCGGRLSRRRKIPFSVLHFFANISFFLLPFLA